MSSSPRDDLIASLIALAVSEVRSGVLSSTSGRLTLQNAIMSIHAAMVFVGRFASLTGVEKKRVVVETMERLTSELEEPLRTMVNAVVKHSDDVIEQLFIISPKVYRATVGCLPCTKKASVVGKKRARKDITPEERADEVVARQNSGSASRESESSL